MRPSTPARRNRTASPAGFSLVEVVVAMTILAIVLMSLAKLSTVVAVRGRGNDLVAMRTAALERESNKFGAIRFDSLAVFPTTSKTFTFGKFAYTRQLALTKVTTTRYTVKIVIIPTNNTAATDSIIFDRTKPASSALCTGC